MAAAAPIREGARTEKARRTPLIVATILASVVAVLVTSCSDGHIDIRSVASAGWSSYGGNAANSNFAYPAVPDDLELSWTRPTGGPVTAPLTISGNGNVGVTSNTANGCNLLILDPRNGRKNFCKRMRAGTEVNSLLVDQYDQPYVGEESMFLAFNAGGAIRWRMPVIGVPLSAKFAAPGEVLVASTQGQLLLLNSQTSEFTAPEVRLRSDLNPDDPTFGFGECVTNGPRCPIPAPPAVDTAHERFFLNFWPQGAIASQIRAMSYRAEDGARTMREIWQADVPGGVIGPPTLSADGSTVYAFSRLGQIVALDAASGTTRWTYDNGGHGFATMTVSPDGLIIPTGVLGAPLTLLRDAGDHAEQVWQRQDLAVVSLSTLTDAGTAWTVIRDEGQDSLSLIEVSTDDGSTQRTLGLPESVGFTTGVSVSPSGQIATATNIGKVYFFDSKQSMESR
ncbi:PQQ-binding-like beta-propeller repeat protein [Gordonia sp. HNM0687]|uniref:PQQ-binding-like beta-propeller repeat protein n=1 Tax=Gordonia mangrovi TaxID=2665643 RepID=A0A6L7GQE8_9ACTN|nr:PQQ-binding-like beta-propeller repeat protein [Gordonia mangrovi]MDY6809473.1 PQQ-binding-like beta-propeller repeat protein [Actinomycetota bacterium]MXP20885.1 PQQ-binding-like beta-propeller repeat protein [Gordonia mangrovi]UVF78563.1 PQQ-binding-like beta-propeller repeat protein [Gordonia mangrovi]